MQGLAGWPERRPVELSTPETGRRAGLCLTARLSVISGLREGLPLGCGLDKTLFSMGIVEWTFSSCSLPAAHTGERSPTRHGRIRVYREARQRPPAWSPPLDATVDSPRGAPSGWVVLRNLRARVGDIPTRLVSWHSERGHFMLDGVDLWQFARYHFSPTQTGGGSESDLEFFV